MYKRLTGWNVGWSQEYWTNYPSQEDRSAHRIVDAVLFSLQMALDES